MAPFPYLPMTAIMAGLVSQQVVQMSIFSYAGFMVEYLGAVDDKDKAGYYAGLLSSGFMIGRTFSSNFWGLVADRHGSRCVLICGVIATAVLSIAFGFSKTFAYAFACRFLLGLFNGIMTASKTLVSEVCGVEHETVGMGLVTSAWSIGAILGPGVGGILAEPAVNFPGTFSQDGVFGRNPYLLSNVVGAALSIAALPLILLFLKGTKGTELGNPPEKAWFSSLWSFFSRGGGAGGGNDRGNGGGNYSINDRGEDVGHASPIDPEYAVAIEALGIRKPSWMQSDAVPPAINGHDVPIEGEVPTKPSWMQPETMPPTFTDSKFPLQYGAERADGKTKEIKQESLLAQRHIVALLFMEAVYSISYSGFDEIYALWALSSASKGGLDWSSQQIGQVFFACGLLVLMFELFAVPYLTPWLGVKLSQRLGSVFEVPIYFLFPLLSRVAGGDLPVTLSALVLLFTCYVCTNSFFVGTALAINTATGASRRGELNGISTMITSVTKAASPIVSASLFAYSINSDYGFPINHHLAFAFLGSMRLIAACMGWNRITDNGNME